MSFDEAQKSENWLAAMQSEYDAIMKNGTWSLCDFPIGKKAIGRKWVFKLKRKPDGSVVIAIRRDLLQKVMLRKRALILMRLLHLLVV